MRGSIKETAGAITGAILLTLSLSVQADMEDDPLLARVVIDQLEKRYTGGGDPWVLEADAWVGKDLHKLWLKVDVERIDGHTEELEIQALYSRAVAVYWDLQIGWRHDDRPSPGNDWLAFGVQGLAPYWIEIDAAIFISDDGQVNFRLDAEYEWMLTQRWVLSPEVGINFHTRDDAARETGSGLSDTEVGLRLRYEVRREFAPYVGLNWTRKYAGTADYARTGGEDVSDVQLVAGIRAWF